MSTYYRYQEVKVAIAHKLMGMDGWTVYGYHADRSDSMTDYYEPAYWGGIAEKNGYILCVDVYGAKKPQEIREYNYSKFTYDTSILEKIEKLSQMTVERGASEQEEASAKRAIAALQEKASEQAENAGKYVVTGYIPGHMAHPPKMNWHIEKDGIYVAKGNGILKYAAVADYFTYGHHKEALDEFRTMDRDLYREKLLRENKVRYGVTRYEEYTDGRIKELEKELELLVQFENFIQKLDSCCQVKLGEGEDVTYEKVTVTKYKKENRAVVTEDGSLKDGQCFILNVNFNYGCHKGYVYRIHESDVGGKPFFNAFRLNGKLTKECLGMSNSSNCWMIGRDDENNNLTKWNDKGSISWCSIVEEEVPYEEEKVVKRVVKPENASSEKGSASGVSDMEDTFQILGFPCELMEDVDTRTQEKIYLVKVTDTLSREDYLQVNSHVKSMGGYYSKFKHAFLFKQDPTVVLKGAV